VPLPTPTGTPLATTLGRLPGKLIYAAAGTVYRVDRSRNVSDILPNWMSAAGMPAVSPDGKTLAFIRWSRYASNIDIYNLRMHQAPSQITDDASTDPTINNSLWAVWPSFSGDGKTILFSSDRYKLQSPASDSRQLDLAIYAMNPDGSNLRQLTVPAQGAGGDTDPQSRGHSSQFLYDHWAYRMQNGLAVGQPYSQLMMGDLKHPGTTWTLTPPSGQIVQPALDSSGNRVVYVQQDGSVSRLVVARIVNTKSGSRLSDQKTIASGEIAQPAFTPDGHWVSYLVAQGTGFSLYLQPASGGPAARIDQAGDQIDAISRPVWTR